MARRSRRWPRFLPRAILAWAIVSQPGCSTLIAMSGAPNLRDLRIESIEIVQEMAAMPEEIRQRPHLQPPIFVHFSTNRDLSVYERVYTATFFPKASLCRDGRPDPEREIWGSMVLRGEIDITSNADGPHRPDENGRYSYTLVLYMRTQSALYSSFIDHDFRRDGEDVCFHFVGGAMLSIPHRSRDFRLPYALVAEALDRAGLPHAATR